MEKQWKALTDSCPNCGDHLEVLSENPEANDTEFDIVLTDGEDVRCVAQCGFVSVISVDEGEAWIQDGNIDELPIDDKSDN